MMKGIIDKSRLERIGRYINRQLVVHRNVENDTKWTTEESMIVELYDNYIELISEINNLQQENNQLKDKLESNWKTLKEWLIDQRKYDHGEDKYGDTLDKMNELEKEND